MEGPNKKNRQKKVKKYEESVVWLDQVTLGIWQATAAQDIIGKIFGVYFPVLAFVAVGFGAALSPAALPPASALSFGGSIY